MRLALRSIVRLAALFTIAFALTGCDDTPSGSYKGTVPGEEGSITFEFQDNNKVKMIGDGPMGKIEFTLDYTIDGDKVNVTMPMGGGTMTLLRKGKNYEATQDGQTVVFVKQ